MKTRLLTAATMIVCVTLIFPSLLATSKIDYEVQAVGAPEWFIIEGLVENILNVTYAELKGFPLISELAMLKCVGGGQGGPSITYNWTGVPLFYLLSVAKVISGGYREVVFNATDGFSSSIPLDVAMDPTTILAFEANGTDLEQITGLGSGYRVVLPCRWGYKWVKWVRQVIVVDYDYKGTYERQGFSDEAVRPNCTTSLTTPMLHNFSSTETRGYLVQALSSSSIEAFNFLENRKFVFSINGPLGTAGYFYVSFPTELLDPPYGVSVDGNIAGFSQTDVSGKAYLFLAYAHSVHTIEVEGTPATAISEGGVPMTIPLMQ